jgi:non-specific serine/threonine protein kinase
MRQPTQQLMPHPWPAVVPARPGEALLGRRQELAELRRTLGSARLVTLTGHSGIGKTALARAAAADYERARREDTWVVDLADLVDPDLLGHSVAGAFGVQLSYGAASADDVAAAVADRTGLLVLDGCEAMLDAAVELVSLLLTTAPRLRVLATSQRHLGVTGEVVVPVGPLTADEAQALFTARAAAALPSFRLTEDNAVVIARLCEALEGVPLAVELAAARIRVLSPQGILDRLGDRQRLLTKGAPDAPARQRSLRASLEASIELCTTDEQLLWARLSVFTGGFPLEAAEVVCAGDGIDGADVFDLVDGLLEKSVLTREDDGASYVRFRMLESLREYAAEQLTAEQRQTGRDRHLAWYADLVHAAAAASFGPEQAEWYRTLRRDHGNLREALRHAVGDPRQAAQALEMVTELESYWAVTGRLGEARHWLERASAVAEADAGTRARALALAAWTATLQGEPATGRSMLDEAVALLAAGTADDAVRARVLVAGAVETIWRGSPAEALEPLEQAVAAARTAGDRPLESSSLLVLALCRGFAGDLDGAGTALQTCLDLTGAAGEVHVRSYALAALGHLALLCGDPEVAADLERQALVMKMDLGDRAATAFVLEVLAWVAAVERRHERAATLLGAADALWRHLGLDPNTVPYLALNRRRSEEHAGIDRGSAAFRVAFRRGAELSDDQVSALALGHAPVEEAPEEEEVPLTRRELEVAHLVGGGLSNREIAEQLRISQRTVESHVDHILRKLGFGSRTQVVAWMVERETRRR